MLTRHRADLRAAAALAAVLALVGAPVGAVWVWVAPRAQAVVGKDGVFLTDPEGQSAVAADGRLAVLAVVAGVLCGVVAFRLLRGRGVAAALGLAVGGFAASVVAWRTGVWLGPEAVSVAAQGATAGTRLDVPLELRATGVLLVWPLAAVTAHLVLTAALVSDEPPGAWRAPGPDVSRDD